MGATVRAKETKMELQTPQMWLMAEKGRLRGGKGGGSLTPGLWGCGAILNLSAKLLFASEDYKRMAVSSDLP